MAMERIDHRLILHTDDTRFFYRELETFNIDLPINDFCWDVVIKLCEISEQYKLTQERNYNIRELEKTATLIGYLTTSSNWRRLIMPSQYHLRIYNPYYSYTDSVRSFIMSIQYRLSRIKRDFLLETRHIKSILGNFEESISPNMIQKVLTWLKKKDKNRYGGIKRGIKEEIILELRTCGMTINPELLCEFIDNNNPMDFAKEWKVKTHRNGKRMKNTEIRKLFKEAFFQRDKDCVRFKIICPCLNCLPKNVENLIISYL